MATDNIALLKRFTEEVWNKGNLQVAEELSANTIAFHDPISKDLTSRDAFKQHMQMLRAAFPDLHVKIDDIVSSGDKVYLRWTCTGTNKGTFLGQPPTNKRSVLTGMSANRIQDGKIVETWMSYDMITVLQQLGIAPMLGQTAAAPTARA